ncbi:hypothetical protein LTR78_009917 [Recurvomyces mirabilis]|uniref:Uncharacterized protein n=1 Tax=Recurvomyces mirabilis TaxID=574656 RepID=A0AAE0WF79_9PEZI|nr:hypothetical protein LTR78_009917 [Recurvomyces mirabilis]KAK5160349.1 hypothetical protein LTS14_001361 [Recurvomyces mirabilis]
MTIDLVYLINDSRRSSRRQDHLARAHTARRNRRQQNAHRISPPASGEPSDGHVGYSLASCQSTILVATSSDQERQHVPPAASPRTVSPVFGALSVGTFDVALAHGKGETIAYYCQSVVINYMSIADTKWFFEAYCRCPVAFHAIHYSVANHRDRVVGRLLETKSAKTIRHKVNALRLLSLAISEYQTDSTDIGWLLLALTALMRNEPTQDDLQPDKLLAFKPWTRDLNNAAVFGRGKFGQTLALHTKAFEQILPARGDMLTKLPRGLAKSIAGLVSYESAAYHVVRLTSAALQ